MKLNIAKLAATCLLAVMPAAIYADEAASEEAAPAEVATVEPTSEQALNSCVDSETPAVAVETASE